METLGVEMAGEFAVYRKLTPFWLGLLAEILIADSYCAAAGGPLACGLILKSSWVFWEIPRILLPLFSVLSGLV